MSEHKKLIVSSDVNVSSSAAQRRQRPVLRVRTGVSRHWGLIDSGAEISVLSERCYRRIPASHKGPLILDREVNLGCRGLSGLVVDSIGDCEVRVMVGSKTYTHVFRVLRDIKKDMIIGSDFLTLHQAALDYQERTLRLGRQIVKLQTEESAGSSDVCLLQVQGKVQVKPQHVTNVQCKAPQKTEPGTYLVEFLENSPFFSDQPGLTVPPSLIEIAEDKSATLSLAHGTAVHYSVPDKTVIAIAEKIDPDSRVDIQSVDILSTKAPDRIQVASKFHSKINDQELIRSKAATDKEWTSVKRLVGKYSHIFASSDDELGTVEGTSAHLDTQGQGPIRQKPYRTPYSKRPEMEDQIKTLQNAGIIQPSDSPWSSPALLVSKKDGSSRLVIDYRKVNKICVPNSYPLPNIDDILAQLSGAKYFSKLDLKSGYHQIKLAEEDRPVTAFVTFMGLYEFTKLPFGLSVAPSIFQSTMNRVLAGALYKHCMCYLDDIVIYSSTFQEHLKHLEDVFQRLENAGMKLKMSKCEFLREQIQFLGHVVSASGCTADPEKVSAIRDLCPPNSVKDVRGFIGLCSYYRRYVPAFSEVAQPLIALTRKNARFVWDDQCQLAFDQLKQLLTEAPVLAHADIGRPYKLYTDASLNCVGAILTQDGPDGHEHVIHYLSQQLSPTARRWSTIEKECFAVVAALKKFRQYLLGSKFTVYTDHKPLRSLFTADMRNAKVQRWGILIDEYQCDIQYRPGKSMKADFLSRLKDPPDVHGKAPCQAVDEETVEVLDSSEGANRASPDFGDTNVSGPPKDVEFPWDKLALVNMQQADERLKEIRNALTADEPSSFTKEFVLENDLLYHISKPVKFDQDYRQQLVIPDVLTKEVLQLFHDEGGHMGVDRTYDKLRRRYFWFNAYRDVVIHVRKCIACNQRNLRQQRAPLGSLPRPSAPFQIIAADLIGPYPESALGNKYILSIVDLYSGWPEAFAIPDKEADTVADVLIREIFPRHSCVDKILTDQGTEFCSAVMKYMTSKLFIHKIRTSPYHPAGNGRVERQNAVLNNIIAKRVCSNGHDWDLHIPAALSAIRTSVNESSKHTPFFLLYGRDPVLPLDTLLRPKHKYHGEDHMPIMLGRLHQAYLDVKQNVDLARARNQRYKEGSKLEPLVVGDAVYYYNPHLGPNETKKFAKFWKPFYRIIAKISDVNFVIKHQPSGKTKLVHINNLRRAYPEDSWDKGYSRPEDLTPTRPLERSKTQKSRLVVSLPLRRQPVRRCRLSAPLTGPSTSTAGTLPGRYSATKRPLDIEDGDGPQPLRRIRLDPPTPDSPVRGTVKRPREDDDAGSGEDDHHSKRLKEELMLLEELKPTRSWWNRFIELFHPG